MKRVILSALLVFFTSFTASAQVRNICRLGISYDISKSNNWGNKQPVITAVSAYSPAELVGLKVNDIITEIDGIETSTLTQEDIKELLNPSDKDEILLTVRNLSYSDKKIRIHKECKKNNAITEEELATAFSMYSLETTTDREFVCPFKTTPAMNNVDYSLFKTFAFSQIDENNSELDIAINEYIEQELIKKGLTHNEENPDLLIQTFYYFDKNPHYKGTSRILIDKEPTFRYDFTQNKMVIVPFLPPSETEAGAEYLLQFGFRLIDQVYSPERVIWECEANELLESSFAIEEYARIHVPLMCAQFPYVKYSRNVPFKVSWKTYNYTGLSYDIDHMAHIVKVEANSPAYTAGLRSRDVLESINKNKINYSTEEFSAAYKGFITGTFKYRDPKTKFTDANGFKRCMYWDNFKYAKVANALHKPANKAVFSYLYYFTPYVNLSGNNTCIFTVLRGKEKVDIAVRPTIRRSTLIEIK